MFDCGYSMVGWIHAMQEPPVMLRDNWIEDAAYIPGMAINERKALWPGLEDDAVYGRHKDKEVNVGFADTHVSLKGADSLEVAYNESRFVNRRPLWLPE
jgi:prepilin-type processing-associated H-X9-DG protein